MFFPSVSQMTVGVLALVGAVQSVAIPSKAAQPSTATKMVSTTRTMATTAATEPTSSTVEAAKPMKTWTSLGDLTAHFDISHKHNTAKGEPIQTCQGGNDVQKDVGLVYCCKAIDFKDRNRGIKCSPALGGSSGFWREHEVCSKDQTVVACCQNAPRDPSGTLICVPQSDYFDMAVSLDTTGSKNPQ